MGLLSDADRGFAQAVSGLVYSNPFLPSRIEFERAALGGEFDERAADWNVRGEPDANRPNVRKMFERAETLVEPLIRALAAGGEKVAGEDARLFEDLAMFVLYYRHRAAILELVGSVRGPDAGPVSGGPMHAPCYAGFAADHERLVGPLRRHLPPGEPPIRAEHLFACCYQIVRAFRMIMAHILGVSQPAARFRAMVWESIFTHDMRRYRRTLYARMGDITTLIAGPSGTGKELAARAIALSRYIPLDAASGKFAQDYAHAFLPINLAALSPTLIESELFGHRRGSFTGAGEDRVGWLEACGPHGTVFIDEVGELSTDIQVKLLRVLQDRTFQRIGDTKLRRFAGKIIAATNRDLAAEIRAGRFREDVYYRLCADVITPPTLAEQLRDAPGELGNLTRFIARRLAGEEERSLAGEAETYVRRHLAGYSWPGNFRELEQCVRNLMIRGRYDPPGSPAAETRWLEAVERGELSAERLLDSYCAHVYARCGNYVEAGRRIGLDRRTVKERALRGGALAGGNRA